MNKSEIINYVMHTPQNPNPWVLGDMLDELETEAAGDFSTCKVTVTNLSSENFLRIQNPIKIYSDTIQKSDYLIGPNDTETLTLVLYKGVQRVVVFETSDECTLTGGVTLRNSEHWANKYEHICIITGDGSFTGTGRNAPLNN